MACTTSSTKVKSRDCFPDGSPLVNFEYGYDDASRITTVRREDGNLIYYGYDTADRLTSEEWYDAGMAPLYGFQWDYDAVGNRTYEKRGEAETYYTYDAANELLHARHLPDDAWSYFQYDPMGNTTAMQEPDGTTYFAYTGAGLVSSIAYKTGVANYFYYDAELRRYAIEESTGLRYFTWDENGMNLLCERDAGGATVAQYAHGHTPVDGIGSMTAARKPDGESTYYQYPIYDHRGTVLRLTDDNATVTATYEYDAWGNALQAEDPPAGNRFRYQSNWASLRDSSMPLCLTPAQVYAPSLGRYTQVSPAADGASTPSRMYAKRGPLPLAATTGWLPGLPGWLPPLSGWIAGLMGPFSDLWDLLHRPAGQCAINPPFPQFVAELSAHGDDGGYGLVTTWDDGALQMGCATCWDNKDTLTCGQPLAADFPCMRYTAEVLNYEGANKEKWSSLSNTWKRYGRPLEKPEGAVVWIYLHEYRHIKAVHKLNDCRYSVLVTVVNAKCKVCCWEYVDYLKAQLVLCDAGFDVRNVANEVWIRPPLQPGRGLMEELLKQVEARQAREKENVKARLAAYENCVAAFFGQG